MESSAGEKGPEMDTSTAAHQAKVTVATVQHWCRMGAVQATKVAGRWIIEATSLARRIALGAKKSKEIVYSVANMVAIGGNRWQRGDKDRVYFNNVHQLMGLELSHYGTGNISSATLDGEHISNSKAYKIADAIDKVWFDAADGKLWFQGATYRREYDTAKDAVVTTIRTRLAAL